ncbi:hypothetical protein AB0O07_12480 [Streptomyces sp. NPDC093085]|uniref:hypothetical protein n=1 Tax=Streptomyces sp. NPDC093085 TaxID=3155068 RepID=UPI003421CB3F
MSGSTSGRPSGRLSGRLSGYRWLALFVGAAALAGLVDGAAALVPDARPRHGTSAVCVGWSTAPDTLGTPGTGDCSVVNDTYGSNGTRNTPPSIEWADPSNRVEHVPEDERVDRSARIRSVD